jgi:succinyl-diaminopimelate desuccinylase
MSRPADLLALTADLVDVGSVSHHEGALADRIEESLSACEHLSVRRIGDNVLARTELGRSSRLVLAGHLDTVPANGNEHARLVGDVLWGLGAADMKGGLAVMTEVLRNTAEPSVDLTFIAYVCEEVDQRFSGLGQIADVDDTWLEADVAILGEPTASVVEAGCQGVLRVGVRVGGERAHSARPWMGINAIHRLAPLLEAVSSYEGRRPVIDGCEYREALQAVRIAGGVANNVVPDEVLVVLNHRFAPDRDVEAAFASVRSVIDGALDSALGDEVALEDSSAAAAPGLSHPVLSRLVAASGAPPRAKLGWTDVSFFAARGMPAANFGPGEPTLAHSAAERVERADLERAYRTLKELVS